jgi:hypothetical protein
LNADHRFDEMSGMLEWIRFLSESGNYVAGETLGFKGCYVSKENVEALESMPGNNKIVSSCYIILAENLDQAVSIVQTNPAIENGAALIEVRPMLPPILAAGQCHTE